MVDFLVKERKLKKLEEEKTKKKRTARKSPLKKGQQTPSVGKARKLLGER